MNDKEFLEIILNGWIEDTGGNLTNHFYREWKKAEQNHYSFAEFFSGLIRLQKGLTANIDHQYYERLNEFYIIQGIYEREGKDLKELEGQEPQKKNYSINLLNITGDTKYLGYTLYQSNIDYIGGQIADAAERAGNEKKSVVQKLLEEKGIFYYEIPGSNVIPSEAATLEPEKMERIIELTKKLNDLSFVTELADKEPGQIKEYLDFHLRIFLRRKGSQNDWIEHTRKLMPNMFSIAQKDAFLTWVEDNQLNDECIDNSKPDIVLKYLRCLSGFWKGKKIMTDKEYDRLIEYARYTMENEITPKKIIPIEQGNSGLGKLFYRQSVYRLWKELQEENGHTQSIWIEFVKKVFKNHYTNSTHDYSKSFSKYNNNYDNDKDSITYK